MEEESTLDESARDLAQRFGVDEGAARVVLYVLTVGLVDDPTADCDALVREFHAANIRFYERYYAPSADYTGFRAAVRVAVRQRAYRLIRGNPALRPCGRCLAPDAFRRAMAYRLSSGKSS